jgi:hypothetical protein|tara:strand:+ start:389 stop:529 length:141 start_codon:yes stop_codon:yes gene_type:complete
MGTTFGLAKRLKAFAVPVSAPQLDPFPMNGLAEGLSLIEEICIRLF